MRKDRNVLRPRADANRRSERGVQSRVDNRQRARERVGDVRVCAPVLFDGYPSGHLSDFRLSKVLGEPYERDHEPGMIVSSNGRTYAGGKAGITRQRNSQRMAVNIKFCVS